MMSMQLIHILQH